MITEDIKQQKRQSKYQIKIASTANEKYAVYRFRYQIYVEEQGKRLSYANHKHRILHDDLDDHAAILYIERGNNVIASLRINWGENINRLHGYSECYGLDKFFGFPLSTLSFTSRLMVSPWMRNSSATLELVKAAYQQGRLRGIKFDFVNCSEQLIPFFLRLGYRYYKSAFLDADVGWRTPMVLVLEDRQHLEAVASPFHVEATRYHNDSFAAKWFSSYTASASLPRSGSDELLKGTNE